MWVVFFRKNSDLARVFDLLRSAKNPIRGKKFPCFPFPPSVPSPSSPSSSHHFLRKSQNVGQFLGGIAKYNFV